MTYTPKLVVFYHFSLAAKTVGRTNCLWRSKKRKNYHQAVIVTGDGDFHCLIEYLEGKGKLLKILAPTKHYSSLLRKFNQKHYIVRIDLLRDSLELKKTGIRGRAKP